MLQTENQRLRTDHAQLKEEIAALRIDHLRAEIDRRFELMEARLVKLERTE